MCDVGQKYSESMFYRNLVGNPDSERQDFPIDRFVSLMEEIKSFRPFISITSTEPLLYKPLPQAIRAARERGMSANVTSNGFLLPDRAEELVDAGLYNLHLSIDGPPAVHDRIRGVPGTFARVVEGIARIAEQKRRTGASCPTVTIGTVVSNLNTGHLLQLMRELPLDHITRVNLTLMSFCHQSLADRHNATWGHVYPVTRACLEGECDPALVDTETLHGELDLIEHEYSGKANLLFPNDRQYLEKYFRKTDEFMDAKPCLFPWYTAQITARGDLIGVTRCFPVTFGNVMNGAFSEAWNGDRMRAFRRNLRRHWRFPACTRCEGVLY
jgi:MoaA/NifB/PqqE/SkfB family radical SAM enzyme